MVGLDKDEVVNLCVIDKIIQQIMARVIVSVTLEITHFY